MENLILENSFATIKQVPLPLNDARNKFYFVIYGEKENLSLKIVGEKELNEIQNIVFKKLYCIAKDDNFQLLNLVSVQNHENFHEISTKKSLNHPSVKVLKKLSAPQVHDQAQVQRETNPFDSAKKSKKAGLTKESFFSTFKKFEREPKKAEEKTMSDSQNKVKVVDNSNDAVVVKSKSSKASVQKKTVKKEVKVSEESLNQEATLKDMFQNDDHDEKYTEDEDKKEDESQEVVKRKKIRKKRKIVKTMTFMEGKYMKTRDVEAWESYSESENEDNQKGNGFGELSKKRKAQEQQHSISSFFTKK